MARMLDAFPIPLGRAGTPEEVAAVKESYTGQFLKPLLPKAALRRDAR